MPNYNQEIIGLKQQQETARKIREGMKPREGQMVSGWYVPPANTQYLADALKQGVSAYGEYKTGKEIKQLEAEKQKMLANLLSGNRDATQAGVPAQQGFDQNRYAQLYQLDPNAAQAYLQRSQFQEGRQDKRDLMQQSIEAENARMEREREIRMQDREYQKRLADENRQKTLEGQKELLGYKSELAQKETGGVPKLTESQAKATTFASQMTGAANEIDDIEKTFKPEGLLNQAQLSLAGGITNILAPADAQKYKQAQNQWSEAFLRVKTGAAATQPEVELNNKTFFPQIGDSPQVIEQKRIAREQAQNDVLNMAGKGRELAVKREEYTSPQNQQVETNRGISQQQNFNQLPKTIQQKKLMEADAILGL